MTDNLKTIFENLQKLFTMENISLLLGIIGSAGTAFTVLSSRKNLKLQLRYFNSSKSKNMALAFVQFNNNSMASILITDVHLVINKNLYPCTKLPVCVQTNYQKKSNSTQEFYNLPMPIQLAGVGGASGYLLFDIPTSDLEYLQNPVVLQVSTNRGKSKKYKLYPDRECL